MARRNPNFAIDVLTMLNTLATGYLYWKLRFALFPGIAGTPPKDTPSAPVVQSPWYGALPSGVAPNGTSFHRGRVAAGSYRGGGNPGAGMETQEWWPQKDSDERSGLS